MEKDTKNNEIEINEQDNNYFGSLKGIGSFTKEDELKGQLYED